MPEFDALDQGDGVKSESDEMGFDLDPVTDPAPEKGGQSEEVPEKPKEETPKPEGKETGAAPSNTEAKQRRISEKKGKISQEEWQETQETVSQQSEEIQNLRFENEKGKYEKKNSIVLSEKYEKKWEELCKLKADPEHKYHRLDFSDLKQLMLDPETLEETEQAEEEVKQRKPVSPPKFDSPAKPKTPAGVDPATYEWLKSQGYSDEQIADSGDITKLM